MIRYEVEGGNLPVVICYPEAGQTLCTESGAMSWMSANIQMTTNSGGGIGKSRLAVSKVQKAVVLVPTPGESSHVIRRGKTDLGIETNLALGRPQNGCAVLGLCGIGGG